MKFKTITKLANNIKTVTKTLSKNDKGEIQKDSDGNQLKGFLSFTFSMGENYVPIKLYNELSKVKFFKDLVKAGDFTVKEDVESEVDDLVADINDIDSKPNQDDIISNMLVPDTLKAIKECKNSKTLLKLLETDSRKSVTIAVEKRIKELNIKIVN